MLKAVGIVLVVMGTAGFGNSLKILLNRHLQQLLEFQDIFIQMELDKKALRLPYGQLLRRSARGRNRLFEEILERIAGELKENHEMDVGILWEKAFVEHRGELLFTQEEQEILISLARTLSVESSSTKACEIYFFRLEKQITQVLEEKKEKQKLYRAVGVLSGLFLVILLL
ncbi:MAG: stage III sporulation protein AB [Roseburia sp.]|nr:stage III sporulation protein AB [Roseburia sp.]